MSKVVDVLEGITKIIIRRRELEKKERGVQRGRDNMGEKPIGWCRHDGIQLPKCEDYPNSCLTCFEANPMQIKRNTGGAG